MIRGGPQNPAQDKQTRHQQQQQQKQKKRLSFKDPEIEGPQKTQFYGGCRPKNPPGNLIDKRKGSLSVENLSLEDQALQIAQSVGTAFSDLSLEETHPTEYFDIANSSAEIEDSKAEALINDCFLRDSSYQRSCQLQNFRISAEDQEFLDDLSPPLQTSDMRCPPVENSEQNPYRNSIPPIEVQEEKYPSSAQHQIQLMKYQLDQQNQQTQLALHQVQLLTDQVGAEGTARRKAQEQNNQLMMQNQELLNHIERLFQQIEDLEKQILVLERSSKISPQVTQLRAPSSYAGNRRLSGDSTSEKPTATGHSIFTPPRRSSLTLNKPSVLQHKPTPNTPQQVPAMQNRRNAIPSPKPFSPIQNRVLDPQIKAKDALHIGDASPPVQSGTLSPFSSGWKLKTIEHSQVEAEKATPGGMRTGSFSSFSKLKPPENISAKSTLFSSNSSISSISGVTNKKYSSSTSDLYNNTSAYQSSKPLVIEDTSTSSKSVISNVSINTATSKLPRFQPYTGRRSSLTKDFDQFSAMGKDKFKTSPQTSLFSK